jgi:type VI secretion system protein ImpC
MVRSFEQTGWCQYLRGPKGGGLVSGLPIALRNFKALEGARQALRWTLKDPDVEIVLY